MLQVKKRNGKLEDFDINKIYNAVNKAFMEVVQISMPEDMRNSITEWCRADVPTHISDGIIDIEDIQDAVEVLLMKAQYYTVAKAYVLYRDMHARLRSEKLLNEITQKLRAETIENQNANVDEKSFGGRIGEATRIVTKDIALNECMSEMAKNNHLNNEIYIHDLDSYAVGMHNCLSIPFDDLLAKGFVTRQAAVRPANSIGTAFQLVAVICQLQSLQQFGGVSATHIDWTMVPYIRKSFYKHFVDGLHYIEQKFEFHELKDIENTSITDSYYLAYPESRSYALDLTIRECHQAVEGMYHNLNTLQSRSGNQLPFTSINYGTCTLPEGRIVIKSLLEASIEGTGPLGETAIFPCGIFQCMKNVNRKEGDPNYDLYKLALKSTAKRLYPNYVNVDWSVNAGYDVNDPVTYCSTMGKWKCSPCKIYWTALAGVTNVANG